MYKTLRNIGLALYLTLAGCAHTDSYPNLKAGECASQQSGLEVCASDEDLDGNRDMLRIKEFDASGNLVRRVHSWDQGEYTEWLYSNGNLIKQVYHSGSVHEVTNYIRDKSGNLLDIEYDWDGDGKIDDRLVSEW